MAKATLRAGWGARTIDFEVETLLRVEDADQLADAVMNDMVMSGLKERVWQAFLDNYDVVVAVFDAPEPDGEVDDNT